MLVTRKECMLNVTDEAGAWERVFGGRKAFCETWKHFCLSSKLWVLSKKNKIECPYDATEAIARQEQGVFETQLYKSCLPMLKTHFAPLSFAQSLLGMGEKGTCQKKNDKKGQ